MLYQRNEKSNLWDNILRERNDISIERNDIMCKRKKLSVGTE